MSAFVCKIEGCDNHRHLDGLCHAHWDIADFERKTAAIEARKALRDEHWDLDRCETVDELKEWLFSLIEEGKL